MFLTIQQKRIEEEIVVKKSKFIATLYYVRSEEEAQDIIKSVKKNYYDARHNCYAYRIIKENETIERFSDDGEPSGTAGAPMLGILSKNNLGNVLVVVTRYFGGILLGTGGLVRAYSDATLKVVDSAKIVKETLGLEVKVEILYANLENLKYYCKKNNLEITNIEYGEKVNCYIDMTNDEYELFSSLMKSDLDVLNHRIIEQKYIRK
ncbi:MAG: YigZ family protein [Clostridiales bacterium]|nr:YigZ family protein [Clostridiales bacterium]